MSSQASPMARARRNARTFPTLGAARAASLAGAIALLAGCQGGAPEPAKPAAAPEAKPAAAPAAAAAEAAAEGGDTVLATYAGKKFTVADYNEAVASLNSRARKSLNESPDRRKQFVENHIISKLIYDEGVERGYDKAPEISRRLEELREHLVVQRVMEEQQSATVSDEEIKTYYDSHTQEFSTEKVKASHILVDNEELAKEIVAKLRADKSQFAALAAEHSKDMSNAKRGGDLGLFGRGRMVKEFEDAAFALPKDGDISDPVQTRFGWHIIMRTGREQGSVQPFDQVKNQIKVKLVSEGRREKTTGFIDDLKKKSAVTVDEKELANVKLGPAPEGADAAAAKKVPGH